jgi:nucleoside-diphosphate kinase
MQASPVILMIVKGVGAVEVVRKMAGVTNGREALPGTIRGDYSVSVQENIVHASDSVETADIEIKRFFRSDEIYEYPQQLLPNIYANDEY